MFSPQSEMRTTPPQRVVHLTRLSALVVFLFAFACNALPASALCMDYLPLPERDLNRRPRQITVADPLMAGESLRFENTTIEISATGNLLIRGSDKKGRPWNAIGRCEFGYLSIWASDLDSNGTNDLILYSHAPHSEPWQPASQLVILSFEENGRPVPWSTRGYFDVDRLGLRDFVDLDADGKSELISQRYEGGFWITSLYEASNSHWTMRTRHDGRDFPLYTRFTYKPNKTVTGREVAAFLSAVNWGNDGSRIALIEEILAPGAGSLLTVFLSDGAKFTASSYGVPSSVVVDEPGRRRIALFSEPNEVRRMLQEIMYRRLPLTISGAKHTKVSPSLLWASVQTPRNSNTVAHRPRAIKPEFMPVELP